MTISSEAFCEKSQREKRVREPSGDQAGSESEQPFFPAEPGCRPVQVVIRRSRLVSVFTTVSEPPRENRIRDPFGDHESREPPNAPQPDGSQRASHFSRLPSALITKRDRWPAFALPPHFLSGRLTCGHPATILWL